MADHKIIVSYGPNELEITSGTASTVAELRTQVQELFNIPKDATVEIDGERVEDEKTAPIANANEVTFVKETGSKA